MSNPKAFRLALDPILEGQGMTFGAFAAACGVSRKTVERWRHHDLPENERLRRHIVHVLRQAPREKLEPLAKVLGVELGPVAEVSAAVNRPGLNAAIYAAADAVDVSPRRVRASLAAALDALAAQGITALHVATVRALLE
jgi:hypothetical protein